MINEGEAIRSTDEDPLEALLAQTGLAVFADDVRSDVDMLLSSGQSLEPAVRKRLIDAAGRGARQWALRHQAGLETLLFDARRAREQDAETVAVNAAVDAGTIRAVERGELTIHGPGPAGVASWALAVGLGRSLLADGLRRSLRVRAGAPSYAGEPDDVRLLPEDERFVEDVLRAFDERDDAGDD